MGVILKIADYIRRKTDYHGEKREAYTEIGGELFSGRVLPQEAPYQIELEEYGDSVIYKMKTGP